MTDPTTFEARLTHALGRYADRVPVDVDPDRLVGTLVGATVSSRPRRRFAFDRARLALAVVAVVAISLAGIALFGGRLLAPVPPVVVVSPSPSASDATAAPSATVSPTPVPTASPSPTPAAVLEWTEHDIGTQPPITNIWRVGEWFVAVGPGSSFADDDPPADTHFIRSRDGQAWETVPAPARGVEVETGTVHDGALWVVGRLGTSADPKRGVWTTQDGATWERVANVKGLDFGPGRVDSMSHASAGWLANARRWIHAEAQEGLMFRSTDGVAWTRLPHTDTDFSFRAGRIASDGERWLGITGRSPGTGDEVWALVSENGTEWTETRIATIPRGPGAPAAIDGTAVAFGPGGFVVVGQQLEGEYPHAVAWVSQDGESWTESSMAGLPDPAGETGLRSVVAFDGGYLASGYRLEDTPSFWTSVDGSSWVQVDDLFGSTPADVDALAASDTTFVAGGQTRDGAAFLWTAPH